jgi:glutamate racemase
MKTGKVGVFDSGVGGLTFLKNIVNLRPDLEYVYFGDSLNAPYGDLKLEDIQSHSKEIIKFLVHKQKIDTVIVACNSAVASGLDELNSISPIPVIGVVKPTIDYLAKTNHEMVGVAATSATIKSGIYQKGIEKCGKKSTSAACPLFVPLIENGVKGQELKRAIEFHLRGLLGKGMTGFVSGCTHYVLIQDEIQKFFKANGERDVEMIFPAVLTAKHVAKVMGEKKKLTTRHPKVTCYFSKIEKHTPALVQTILEGMINPKDIKLVALNKKESLLDS